jgi:hypothetical protein
VTEAAETLQTYENLAMREFLTVGAQLTPHVEVAGNPWSREVREMYGLSLEEPDRESVGPVATETVNHESPDA